MSKVLELRQDRAAIVAQMNAIIAKDVQTDADNARWKELDEQQKRFKEQIDRFEATDALNKDLGTVNNRDLPRIDTLEGRVAASHGVAARVTEIRNSDEYKAQFDTYLRTGRGQPLQEELRTYNGLGDANSGVDGFTLVPVGFQKNLEKRLKAIGGVRQVAQVITTATGNTLHWPRVDDTANQGSWVAEAAAVTQTNPSFDDIVISAFLGSSDQVLVSVQLLQDSAFDLEQYLAEAMSIRLQRLTNVGYTTGSGTGQPQGIITALVADGTRTVLAQGANSNSGAAGDTEVNSIGSDDLDNLIAKVDPLYRPNGSFMANMATWDALRKVKDKYGRPIWSAGLAEAEDDKIRGYSYVYNQNMDKIAASANSVLFGDFSKYIVRDVLGFQLVRFNELYMTNHQVGFQAYLRTDGKLIQPVAFSMLQHPLS